jgi:hypothetical protein
MPEVLIPDDMETEEQERQSVDQMPPSALAILNQSEHAAMVQTANLRDNRRRLADFDSKLKAYATHSQPIALSMFYSLPRANKRIIGPSIRFAEVVAPCWKNCAVGSRAIGDAAKTVTAQGIFLDYEANLRNSIEVPRRITDSEGNRYSDDMVITTINAAMSVARRNAVLKGGVPQALWTPAYEDAQLTAVGKAISHAQRVDEAMDYLTKQGVTEWLILNAVGVPSIKELETEHLLTLRVLCQEIKRGEKSIEEVFGSPYDKEIESLFTQLKKNGTQQRMLRNSYMGRAKDLLDYLRGQTGPAPRTAAPAKPAAPAPTPLAPEPPPAEPAQPVAVQASAPEAEPGDAYEAAGGDASFSEPGEPEPPPVAPTMTQSPGTNLPPYTAGGPRQTSMEPPPKKRGSRKPPQSDPGPQDAGELESEGDQFAF